MAAKKKKKHYPAPSATVVQPAGGIKTTSRRAILAGAVILLVTCAAYLPAFNAGYVWDDDLYLYNNPLIHAPDGLYRLWCTTQPQEYYPLTYTMLWLEWRIAGNNPQLYHAMNILLHGLSAVLLWLVLRKLKVPAALLAGLIFAVHPVAATTGAWIAERKNTLSMLLYLLSLLSWLEFEDGGRKRAYAGALFLFVAAMLAKTSVVMLPVVLLLLAWWRRGRICRQDIVRVIPFFAAALALAAVTIWFHARSPDMAMIPDTPLATRLLAPGWVFWFYLYKVLLPVNLMMIYPQWDIDGGNPAAYVPLAALLALMFTLWYFRKGWGRGLLLAMAYFLVSLFPVIGFFKMSAEQHLYVFDHLQYVAMIGVIALAAAAGEFALRRLNMPAAVSRICAITLLLILGTLTWFHCTTFKDMETLFNDNLKKNDKACAAYYNLGIVLSLRGEFDKAIAYYRKALELKPDYAKVYNNLGNISAGRGQVGEAIVQFRKALEIKSNYAEARYNLGNMLAGRGDVDEAIAQYRKALEINPDYANAHINLGNILASRGQLDEAIVQFRKALEIKPDSANVLNNLGLALSMHGQVDEAITHYQKALEINPDFADARRNLEMALSKR